MRYNGTVYRPPIEADTLLLPITEGCSHNSCAFCNMYQGIPFRMLSLEEVEERLRREASPFRGQASSGRLRHRRSLRVQKRRILRLPRTSTSVCVGGGVR